MHAHFNVNTTAPQRARPAESCLTSYGAPSTHSTFAVAWFMWLLTEAYYHRRVFSFRTFRFEKLKDHPRESRTFGVYVGLLAVALLPVPWSRTVVKVSTGCRHHCCHYCHYCHYCLYCHHH